MNGSLIEFDIYHLYIGRDTSYESNHELAQTQLRLRKIVPQQIYKST